MRSQLAERARAGQICPVTTPAPDRILVVRRRYLGDIVLLGSVFRNLRLHWPEAVLAAVVEYPYADILALNPDVDTVLTFPRRGRDWLGFVRRLRHNRFTHVLDYDNTEKTALVSWFSGAGVRVAFDRQFIPFRSRWLYTHYAQISNQEYSSQPITATYHTLLRMIDVPVVSKEVRLVPRADDRAAAARLVAGPHKKLLVHPGTRSTYRLWPVERFAAVCDRVQDLLGAQVFIAAGPGERSVAHLIRQHAQSHVVVLDQPFTTPQFAALLAQFDLLLCHDSGPMHISAAVGTPVVALYGSQNAAIWRPHGEGHTVLQTPLPCSCFPECERPGPCVPIDSYKSYCVRKLDVETVVSAVIQKLNSPPRHK